MQKTGKITINGRNIQKSLTRINVILAAGEYIELTDDILAIEYSTEIEKEFGFNLGGYPTHFSTGNISVSGTITITDGGISKLDAYALQNKALNLLDLGQTFDMDIQVEYTLNDGIVETDLLHICHFTTYPRGVNKDTLINERSIDFISAQLLKI